MARDVEAPIKARYAIEQSPMREAIARRMVADLRPVQVVEELIEFAAKPLVG